MYAGKTCNICRYFPAICKYYRVFPADIAEDHLNHPVNPCKHLQCGDHYLPIPAASTTGRILSFQTLIMMSCLSAIGLSENLIFNVTRVHHCRPCCFKNQIYYVQDSKLGNQKIKKLLINKVHVTRYFKF